MDWVGTRLGVGRTVRRLLRHVEELQGTWARRVEVGLRKSGG